MAYEPVDPPAARVVRAIGLALIVIVIVPILLVAALFVHGYFAFYKQVRNIPPQQFGTGTFYSGELSDPEGLVQSISSDAATRISSDPKAFFAAIPDGAEWRPTPAPASAFRPPDCGGFWCSHGAVAKNGLQWATRPGSYYRHWGTSDEFLLLVNPHEQKVIVGYFYS
jgi:hypothetical protein